MSCDLFKFVCLNIWLGHKSRKNWSILMKFGLVFAVNNINLCTVHWKLWPYIRYILQSCIKLLNIFFHLSYVVHKFMCEYQCHNKNEFYYGFSTTTYSFEIKYRDIEEGFCGVVKDFSSQINSDFFSNIFLKIFFPNFVLEFFLFHDIFWTNDPIFIHMFVIV